MAMGASPPPSVPRVERPVPLRARVYETLLDLIVSRSLRPGQHLVESELAEQLGVSRQPVREALQRLNTEGWVDLRPGHGAYVHVPSAKEADQLLAVRALLETEAARLAALNCDSGAGVEHLRELWRRGVAALEAEDVDTMVAVNAELHAYVTELSGNDALAELTAQVDRRVRWYYSAVASGRGRASWNEHAELIDAIAAGDPDKASSIMLEHTEQTRLSYAEIREESADA